MSSLLTLTIANVKSFVRDRAALFWTLAFPLIFILLFGTIFSGGGDLNYKIGWVDQDKTPASANLHQIFGSFGTFTLFEGSLDDELAAMRKGDVRGVIVVPEGYSRAVAAAETGVPNGGVAGLSVTLTVYTDPSQQATSAIIAGITNSVVGRINQGDRPTTISVQAQAIQSAGITATAYFVPSILAMALMQLGLFGAIPLVQQREKLILKRLSATPLRRWTLVGSNVVMRLIVALGQTLLIVGVGAVVFAVTILGSPLVVAFLVILGALTFIALGYLVASFAPTEESANMITSILQFPLMFLSGIFFPLDQMPGWLRTVAAFLPLTYLGDALRQVMVGGTPFVPVIVSVAVLAAWLAVCLGISSRFFKWQ